MLPAIDDRDSSARDDVEPLVAAAMSVVGSTFGFTRRQHHRRRLGAPVATLDVETLPKSWTISFHVRAGTSLRRFARTPWRFARQTLRHARGSRRLPR